MDWHDRWGCMPSTQQGSVLFALMVWQSLWQAQKQSKNGRPYMVVTGSTEQPVGTFVFLAPCLRTESPQPVSSAERRWSTGMNAAKGSRQTSRVPSEDAVAPEAKSPGPVACCPSVGVGTRRGWLRLLEVGSLPLAGGGVGWQGAGVLSGASVHPGVYTVAHMELLLCRGI